MLVENNRNFRNTPGKLFSYRVLLVFVAVLCGTIFLLTSARTATAPSAITYQGRLYSGSFAVTSTVDMKLLLYTAPTGGSVVYTASGTVGTPHAVSTTPTNGLFTVTLGDPGTNSVDPTVFQNNGDLYLEVEVNGEVMQPRKHITAVPYAFNAKYLDGVAASSTPSAARYIPISDPNGNFNLYGVTSTRVNATNVVATSVTTTNFYTIGLATTDFTASNITSTNFNSLNLVVTGATSTNLFADGIQFTNLLGVNATTTNFYVTSLTGISGIFTGVTSTNISGANVSVGNVTSTNLYVSGALSLPSNSISDGMVVNSLTINAGTIDNTPIGASTPSTGVFTNVTSTGLVFTNAYGTTSSIAYINATAVTSTGGTFTSLSTTNLNATNATGTNLSLSGQVNISGNGNQPLTFGSSTVSQITYLGNGTSSTVNIATGAGTSTVAVGTNGSAGSITLGNSSVGVSMTTSTITYLNNRNVTSTGWFQFNNMAGTTSTITYLNFQNATGTLFRVNTILATTGTYGYGNFTSVTSSAINFNNAVGVTSTITYINALNVTSTNLTLTGLFNFINATGTSITSTNAAFTSSIKLTSITNCLAANNQALQTGSDGAVSCGTIPPGSGGGNVGTSTPNYFTFYNGVNSVTGTPYMTVSGDKIAFTTNTTFTSSTITYLNAGAVTSTFLQLVTTDSNTTFRSVSTGYSEFDIWHDSQGVTINVNPGGGVPGDLNIGNNGGAHSVFRESGNFDFNPGNDAGLGITVNGFLRVSGTSTLATTTISTSTITRLNFTSATGTNLNILATSTFGRSIGINTSSPRATFEIQGNKPLSGDTSTIDSRNAEVLSIWNSDTQILNAGIASNGNPIFDVFGNIRASTLEGNGFGGDLHVTSWSSSGILYLEAGNLTALEIDRNAIIVDLPFRALNATSSFATTTINSSTILSLNFNNATGTNLNLTGLFKFVNATGTSITSTNGYFTNLAVSSFSPSNIIANSITSTNLFATTSRFVNATTTNLYASGSSSLLTLTVGTTTSGGGIPLYVAQNGTYQSAVFDGTVGIGADPSTNSNNVLTLGSAYDASLIIESGTAGDASGIFFNQGAGVNSARIYVQGTSRDLVLYNAYSGAGNIVFQTNAGQGVYISTSSPFYVRSTTTLATTTISTSTITRLNFNSATGTNLNLTNLFTYTNASGTSITSTNGYFTNLSVGSFNPTNLNVGSVTTTNLFATNTRLVNLTVTGTSTLATTTFNRYVGFGTTSPQAGAHVYNNTLLVDSPVNPLLRGFVSNSSFIGGGSIYVSGKYAYVPGSPGLSIVDITDPNNPRFISYTVDSQRIGTPYSVFVAGKYAYVRAETKNGLAVLDVSNPYSPTTTGFTSSTKLAQNQTNGASGMYVSGRYAYVAGFQSNSLVIIDISNPYAPTTTGFVTDATRLAGAADVYVSGKYAYVVSQTGAGLAVVDISNPSNPVVVGNTNHAMYGAPWSVYVSGRYAYMTDYMNNSIAILDISNPSAPTTTAYYDGASRMTGPQEIFVSGKYAYVADQNGTVGANKLTVVDISSSTAPRIVGGATGNDYGSSVFVSGKYAYVLLGGNSSLNIFDLGGADISAATIGNITTNDLTVWDNADFGNNIYVRNALNVGDGGIFISGGLAAYGTTTLALSQSSTVGVGTNSAKAKLHLFDGTLLVDNPNNPLEKGYVAGTAFFSRARGMDVSGKYLYAAMNNGLAVMDNSDPNSPVLVGYTSSTIYLEGASDVKVAGRYAYLVAGGSNKLTVVDIADPYSPTTTSFVSSSVFLDADSVAISGNYAYVSASNGHYIISIDISNPRAPRIVGTYSNNTTINLPSGIVVVGKYAYVKGYGNSSFGVFDVSDPANIRLAGSITSATQLKVGADRGIYVSGKYAYVTGYYGNSLTIIDVSSSSNPTIIGYTSSTMLKGARGLTVAGKYAYVAGYSLNGSIGIVDISSSTAPTTTGYITGGKIWYPTDVVMSGKYLYLGGEASANPVIVFDMKGADISAAMIGALSTNQLTVTENADIGNSLYIRNSLNVGIGGISTDGEVNVGGTLSVNSPVSPKVVGSITGLTDYSSVYVSGKYAYAVAMAGNTLDVIDVTDPSRPNVVGNISEVVSGPNGIYVAGKYAYIIGDSIQGTGGGSLTIIDVSNPSAPVFVASTSPSGGLDSATSYMGNFGVVVSGKYAYSIAYWGDTFTSIDISNPRAPKVVSSIFDSTYMQGPNAIYISGKYAYVAAKDGNGLAVIDISDPANMSLVGSASSTYLKGANSVYVSGKYAYVASQNVNGLAIVDISSSTSPTTTGFTSSTYMNAAKSVYVSGRYAYVASAGNNGIAIVDVSSSTNPVVVGNASDVTKLGGAQNIFVSGKYAYVAAPTGNSFSVVDISGADISSANIGNLSTNDLTIFENADVGNSLYVRNSLNVGAGGLMTEGGLSVYGTTTLAISTSSYVGIGTTTPRAKLHVYDGTLLVDNPVNLKPLGYASIWSETIYVQGKYAYVSTYSNNGMAIIDISVPGSPTIVGQTSHSSYASASGIYVSGNYAYVVARNGPTLGIVDVSKPTVPTTTAIITLTGGAEKVYVSGKYAYTVGSAGLYIVDISNPKSPTTTGYTSAGAGGLGLYVSGRFAYVANGSNHALTIIDISNPANPTLAGYVLDTSRLAYARSVYVSGRYAYVGGGDINGGLAVVDISSSTAPTVVGFTSSTKINDVWGVYVSGKYAYTAGNGDSQYLGVIDVSNPANPTTTGSYFFPYALTGVFVSGKYAYVGTPNRFYTVDIGGADISAATIGNVAANDLTVWENADIGNNLYVRNGLNVGLGGLFSQGALTIMAPSSTSATTSILTVIGNTTITGTTTLATTTISSTTIGSANITNLVVGSCVGCMNGTELSMQNITTTNLYASGTIRTKGALNVDSPTALSFVGFTSSSKMTRASDVFVSGKYAYVGADLGDGLSIVDISDPAKPTTTGSVTVAGPTAVYVSGKYAYTSTRWDQVFTIVDVSDVKKPTVVGTLNNALLANGTSVYVSGKYAFVTANTSHSLVVIDISNPSAPKIAGSVTDGVRLESAESVFVSGKYAYVAPWSVGHGLVVVDISNAQSPQIVGVASSTLYSNGAMDVYVSGKYAYVGSDQGDLFIMDISSSTAPTTTGRIQDAAMANANRVVVAGKYAYVAGGSSGTITVIDISSSTAPTLVTSVADATYTGGINSLFVSGKYLYAAAGNKNGISILDLKGADISVANVGNLATNQLTVWENADVGNNLYVRTALNVGLGGIFTDGGVNASATSTFRTAVGIGTTTPRESLHVYNGTLLVDGPVNPTIKGMLDLHWTRIPLDIDVSGKYAYTANGNGNSVSVIDLSDPDNMVEVGYTEHATKLAGVSYGSLSGKYFYVVSTGGNLFAVVDVTNPGAPTTTSFITNATLMSAPTGIYVSGKYAYVPTMNSGLTIIDISNPKDPRIVSNLAGATGGVYVSGKYAYVGGTYTNAFGVIDVSDPLNPSTVGGVVDADLLAGANSVYVSGKYAYVTAENSDGLAVIDISSTTNPLIAGFVSSTILDAANSVKVSGKYAYVTADGPTGEFVVIDVSSSTSPRIIGSLSGFSNPPVDLAVAGKYAYLVDSGAVYAIDLKGADISVANVGNLATNQLTVWENADVGNNLYVHNALNVGLGGIFTDGGIDANGTSTFAINQSSTVGIGTRDPKAKLHVYDGTLLVDSPINTFEVSNIVDFFRFGPSEIELSGKFMYVLNNTKHSLNIIDVSDVKNPTTTAITSSTLLNGAVAMAVAGKHVYFVNNGKNVFGVIDVSNPGAPTTTGFASTTLLDSATDLVVVGKYAYITRTTGFTIMDISDPRSPTTTGYLTASGAGRRLHVVGKYAYVVRDWQNQLIVIDISNPENPTVVSSMTDNARLKYGTDIYVSGRFAYIAASNGNGLAIVDISSSTRPTTTGFTSSTGMHASGGVYVSGKYAYVAGDDGYAIVDISSSTEPTTTANILNPNVLATRPVVVGKYAYFAMNGGYMISDIGGADISAAHIGNLATNDLTVYENADIGSLFVRNSINVGPGGIFTDDGIHANGTSTFAVNASSSVGIGTNKPQEKLHVSDGTLLIDNPKNPKMVSAEIDTRIGQSNDVYVSGKYAYHTDDLHNGLFIRDISDPKYPKMVGVMYNTSTLGGADEIVVVGKYAYITAPNANGLAIIDISDPSAPTTTGFTSSTALEGGAGLYISGKYAYVAATGNNGLTIVDISDPTAPTTTAALVDTGNLGGTDAVYVSGKFAYMNDGWNNGFTIVDISKPTAPVVVGHTVHDSYFTHSYAIQVVGRYAYVTTRYKNGLAIVDISSSTRPTTTGFTSSTAMTGAWDVKVAGKYAYVAGYEFGTLAVVDISSSTKPTTTGSIEFNGQPTSVALSGRHAYLNNRWGGNMPIIDIKGAEITNANIGNISSNNLTVYQDADIGDSLFVRGGINVGTGGIYTQGGVTANTTSTFLGNMAIGTSTFFSSARLIVDAGTSTNYGLAINGFARATGGFFASTSLDLAERYPIDPSCVANGNCPEAGDVICQVETTSSIVVEKCSVPYSDKALGIVSTDPGFVLEGGFTEDNSRRIALAGRVPVKISLENGPINFGDELAPASLPGYAMKATVAGPTVGKALESFSGASTGVITAYVRLGWNHSLTEAVVATTTAETSGVSFLNSILTALSKIGVYIEQGIVRATEFVSNKVTTNELCVGSTCITEAELKALLEKNQIQAVQTSTPSAPIDTTAPTTTPIVEQISPASSTPETTQTSTPPVIETTTPSTTPVADTTTSPADSTTPVITSPEPVVEPTPAPADSTSQPPSEI